MSLSSVIRQLAAAARLLLALTVVLGVAYPAVVWGVGRIGLSAQADGSRVERDDAVVGSSLLGQEFNGAQWFHPRPSASEYAGDSSGGTNLAASSPDQQQAVAQRREAFGEAHPGAAAPADALTASASGLDPHISPANALAQAESVAAARGLPRDRVERLVCDHVQGRTLGFLGQPRVNVLELNLALEGLSADAGDR